MKAVEAVKEKFYCFLGNVHPTYYQSRGWGPWLVFVGKYDFGFIGYFLLAIKVLISLTQGLMALDSELISPWK